jgi:ribosomal protein S18 acetylase RimI-like enzyme
VPQEINIRSATKSDRGSIWKIFREVIAAGETYPLDRETSREDALSYWFQRDAHVFVAEKNAEPVGKAAGFPGTLPESSTAKAQNCEVLGSYALHANQSGGGAHVANAAFIVGNNARGQGIGRAMAGHCLAEARRLGFRAIQFNFVVSTNESAVKLWHDLGMKIIGTLPGAFRSPTRGYVDVYVMYQQFI